jgi:quercetin dioxygenase-like cupin family protein
MDVQPKQPSAKGLAEWFTGDVWIDAIARGAEPSRIRVSAVHFTPGARTAWHAHALRQTLYVTEGAGVVQSRGGGIVDIRPGDVISTPPDEWHWHGASADHDENLDDRRCRRGPRARDGVGSARHRRRVPPAARGEGLGRSASSVDVN